MGRGFLHSLVAGVGFGISAIKARGLVGRLDGRRRMRQRERWIGSLFCRISRGRRMLRMRWCGGLSGLL